MILSVHLTLGAVGALLFLTMAVLEWGAALAAFEDGRDWVAGRAAGCSVVYLLVGSALLGAVAPQVAVVL